MAMPRLFYLICWPLMALVTACVCAFEWVLHTKPELVQPTTEYALHEINVTGHAVQRETKATVTHLPLRRSRNSAANHVVMLNSLGTPLAA